MDLSTKEKVHMEVQCRNMAKNTMQLQEKLQEEILQREEAHSTLETFRQDVGNVSQAILDLENKIDSF